MSEGSAARPAVGQPPAGTPRPVRPPGAAGLPGFADRLARQLAGIDSWNASRPLRAETIRRAATSREQRLDVQRRLASLDRTQDAILDAVTCELARDPEPMTPPGRTAVIAHASAWYASRLADLLTLAGITVLATTDDAPEALGTLVAEQPDVLMCGERLRMMTGCMLLAEAALFAPHTLLVAQVDDGSEQMALAAGATVTVLRGDPPAEVVATLIALLTDGR